MPEDEAFRGEVHRRFWIRRCEHAGIDLCGEPVPYSVQKRSNSGKKDRFSHPSGRWMGQITQNGGSELTKDG
jgi:hypothetical protein